MSLCKDRDVWPYKLHLLAQVIREYLAGHQERPQRGDYRRLERVHSIDCTRERKAWREAAKGEKRR